MRTKRVTETWEYYRDNCPGFKEPMRKRFRELDEYVAGLEELLHDVYSLHWNGLDCTECPWFDKCDTEGGCPWLGIMRDRMDELGIPRCQ